MTLNIFLLLLLVTSVFTGLFTQGIKTWLSDMNKSYHANILAGAVSIALSMLIGAAYIILTGSALNDKMFVYLIALILLSWLSAMVGYDKVVQAILQIQNGR